MPIYNEIKERIEYERKGHPTIGHVKQYRQMQKYLELLLKALELSTNEMERRQAKGMFRAVPKENTANYWIEIASKDH